MPSVTGGPSTIPDPSKPSDVLPSNDNSGLPVRGDFKDVDCDERLAFVKGGHKARKFGALSTDDVD